MAIVQRQQTMRNPLYGLGSDIPKNIPMTQQERVKTAVEQARDTFDRLVNLRINKPPLPKSEVKEYSVATLPGGRLLRSTGREKVSIPTKKIEKTQKQQQQSTAPIANKAGVARTINDLLLQIAIPANQMGTGANRGFALANYVNKILNPQLPTAAGVSAPAMLPSPQAVAKFYRPSAIANLPPLVRKVESTFASPASRYGTFLENTDRIQQEMARRFLSQFTRGERQAAYGALGGTGRAPLTSGYDTGRYIMPAAKTAASATIKPQTMSPSAGMIY